MTDAFLNSWTEFLAEVQSTRRRLLSELRELHSELAAITSDLSERYEAVGTIYMERGRVESLRTVFDDKARSLLLDPVERLSKQRIQDRLPQAFEDFRTRLFDAARKLPVRAEVSPVELIRTLPEGTRLPPALRWSRWQDRVRVVPVRSSVLRCMDAARWRASRAEGAVYLVFAQGVLGVLDPWQAVRARLLWQLKGEEAETDDTAKHRATWKQQAERRDLDWDRASGVIDRIVSDLDLGLVRRVVREGTSLGSRIRRSRRRHEYIGYWARQSRAVRALVEIEINLVRLGFEAGDLASEVVEEVADERKAVLDELTESIRALRGWSPGQGDPLPPATAVLTSGRERLTSWSARLGRAAQSALPPDIEALDPHRALPGWRSPWRVLHPQSDFVSAVETSSETIRSALEDLEADHKGLLREIERAREVVQFSIQTSEQDHSTETTLIGESIANAASLIEHERDTLSARMPAVQAGIVEATASSFYQFHVGFEQGRVDLWSYLVREGVARGFRRLLRGGLVYGRRFGLEALNRVRSSYHRMLVGIGWEVPLESGLVDVERWNYFDERTAAGPGRTSLPLIYERLFRPQPVEDPRFLVGRESEMAALAESRESWKAGRHSAVLIIGQRGSGKTSLLNCMLGRFFAADKVVCGSFSTRLTTASGVRRFVADLVGAPEEALIENLSTEPRVVVLEEIARTYLRVVGGTEGIAELLRIVSLTSRKTLWILSIAAEAYRFLDAAVGMSRHFSHRINASSVEPGQLQEAILQRHNLSGLRLRFAASAGGGRFKVWVQRQAGLADSPETTFFNTLYRQSGGVFRSAFELWQHQIERAEGGVLFMHQSRPSNQAEVVKGLAEDDMFSLQMLLQHGSLTPEEHARIFDGQPDRSRIVFEHLVGRGIVEPEPGAPGFRVRPSAGMLVRSALNAQNLI